MPSKADMSADAARAPPAPADRIRRGRLTSPPPGATEGGPVGSRERPAAKVKPSSWNGTLREGAGLAIAIAQHEGGQLARLLTRPLHTLDPWQRTTADRLLIAPQDIRTADATVAGDIYAGHLVFGGSFIDAHGQSPFEIEPPNQAWAEELHGFGWLRHLRAANTGLSRANARALVEDWIGHSETRGADIAWRPAVVARRLLSWLSQSTVILAPPEAVFYRKFMKSIGRQVAYLRRAVAGGAVRGGDRLLAAIALAAAGLCADGLAAARRQGSRLLAEELEGQVLPDGGHVSRNPAVLVELLLDLLPLRQAYAARGAPVPPPLLNAIDRIIPMIRMFRHGDGTLALFNGMGVTEPDVLATVLTYDDVRARPLLNAPHSGYQRLEANGTLVICDTGRPPPPAFGERTHAGTLSLEMSIGSQKLVINCGRPTSRNRDANQAARVTAAHSTLVVENSSSSRFAGPALRRWFGDAIVDGPKNVTLARSDEAGSQTLETSHDGYAEQFGLVHKRRLSLDRSGGSLRGEDSLVPAHPSFEPASLFVVRFHLHPSVRHQTVQGGTAVLLTLPDDDQWLFEADHAVAEVEESILFAAAHGSRPTSQIVISGRYPDATSISWSLTRLSGLRA